MSRYDPQGIYSRPSNYTKTGQIIQKKPYKVQSAFTNDEIPRSLSVLKTFGYKVYPPGSLIFNQSDLFYPFSFYYDQVTSTHNFLLTDLYNNISQAFNNLKQIPLSLITNSFVLIGISSVKFTSTSDSQYHLQMTFYSNNQSQSSPQIAISTNSSKFGILPVINSSLDKAAYILEYEGTGSSLQFVTFNDQDIPFDSVSYVLDYSLWPQFYSGNITSNYNLFSVTSSSDLAVLRYYSISGYVYINLKL